MPINRRLCGRFKTDYRALSNKLIVAAIAASLHGGRFIGKPFVSELFAQIERLEIIRCRLMLYEKLRYE